MTDQAVDTEGMEEYRRALADFFPDLTGEEFADMAPHLELQGISAGTVISSEGDRVTHLGFLLDGKLSVRKANEFSDRPILVAVLEGGAVFGERLLAGEVRTDVTLAAMEDSRALRIQYDRLGQIIHDNPSLGIKILTRCLKACSKRLQGATARIVDLL